MNKNKTVSAEQLTQYFKGASTFSVKEKLYWYRLILDALQLANEQEKSKDAKRFKYDFDKHKVVTAAIEALLHEQQDYSHGLIPVLKANQEQLRDAAVTQLKQLLQDYLNDAELYEKESTFWNNPISGHSEVLQGVGLLPFIDREDFREVRRAAYTKSCERIYKACQDIEQEISSADISGIRAAWLGQLFMAYEEALAHVYGAWRYSRMLNDLSLKDFRYQGNEATAPQNEKDKAMLAELMLLSGHKPNSDLHEEAHEHEHGESCSCMHE